jgi:hypothetical protein
LSEQEKRSPQVVREFEALVSHYRRRAVSGAIVLAWLDDGWSQEKIWKTDDGPGRWLAVRVRAVLVEADAGEIDDDRARAAVGALLPEYRRRRDVLDWEV